MEVSPDLASQRIAARLVNEFLLDILWAGRGQGDIIDRLILVSLFEPYLSFRIGPGGPEPAAGGGDPAALASIGGIAQSLNMPFETVRRRVARFQERGYCTVTRRGVHLSDEVFDDPALRATATRLVGLVKLLYLRLCRCGLIAARPASGAPIGAFDEWEVVRHTLNFLLRTSEPLTRHFRHPLSGVILMELVRQNTAHLPDSERGGNLPGAEGFVPDALRRPARAATLASRLGLSQETVRRHIVQLTEDGRCQRTSGGLIVPAAALASPPLLEVMKRFYANVLRLFAAVPDHWLVHWQQEEEHELL